MLTYYYDKEADVFYFSEGKPSAKDNTVEVGNDVLARVDSRTKRIRGFTLLNASRRTAHTSQAVTLPFTLSSVSAR